MRKIFAVVAVALAISGCEKTPESTVRTSNHEIAVEKLFTYDGCPMYRFEDGRYVHWVKCENSTNVQTSEHVSCGKNCVRETRVPTTEK